MQPIHENAAARIMVWTVVGALLSMLPIFAVSGLRLDLVSTGEAAMVVLGFVPFAIYARWRRMYALPAALECASAVFALAVPVLVWTYAAMKTHVPLADPGLVAMDATLGFDWHAFIDFVDRRPWLSTTLMFAYASFPFQLLLLPVALALAGRSTRAYAMVFTYLTICLLSSIIGIWYPSQGAYPVYGVAQADLASINARFGYFFLDQFDALRSASDEIFTIVLGDSAGILTFPSVHAAVAMLCIWAAWDVRILRWPMLLVNVAMAVSAVSHGSHYLVDVVAGMGVAAFCISISSALFYRSSADESVVLARLARARVRLRPSGRSPAEVSG